MITTRRTFAAVLLLSSALGSVSACRGCDEKAASSPGATADAATEAAATDAAATDGAKPYLPARPLNNNAPAPLSVVESALFTLRPQLNACYRAASEHDPKLVGNATLAVTIGGDGKVTDVSTVSQTGLDAAMVGCLTNVVKGAVFPPPADGGPAVIKVPLSFRPPPGRLTAGLGADASVEAGSDAAPAARH